MAATRRGKNDKRGWERCLEKGGGRERERDHGPHDPRRDGLGHCEERRRGEESSIDEIWRVTP
eukprot:scaffold282938_cov18-Tisochrysis_lutea.AAC.1